MHIVKQAVSVGGFRIAVTFEDGRVKLLDLEPHLDGEIFEPLRDPAFFSRFQVDEGTDTICWPNGADFSPDWLYAQGVDAAAVSHSA